MSPTDLLINSHRREGDSPGATKQMAIEALADPLANLAIAAAGKLYASVVRGPNPGAIGASGNGGVVAVYGTDF